MTRTLTAVAVVALVVLSGCSVIGGEGSTATPVAPTDESDPTPEPTATPVPTPTPWSTATATPAPTATPTATPAPQSTPAGDLEPVSALSALPPGVTDGSVTNVSALAVANQDRLTAGGYDLYMTVANSSRAGESRFRVANDTQASLVRLTEAPGAANPADLSVYFDATESGVYNRTSDEIAYGNGPTRTRFGAQFIVGFAYLLPQAYVSAPAWETAGSYTTDAGEERLVLQADSLREPDERQTGTGGVSDGREQVQSVDARLEVTPEGLARELDVTLDIVRPNGQSYTQTVSYAAADLEPASLDRPAWLSEPPQVQASVTADNRLLVVEHTGGPTIEAGTNLTVGGGFRSIGNVSADRRISEGDTLYVYTTGEGVDRTPRLSVNHRPDLPADATAFSGQVALGGSQDDYEFAAGVEIGRDDGDVVAVARSRLDRR